MCHGAVQVSWTAIVILELSKILPYAPNWKEAKRHKEAERTITWATQQEECDTQVTKMAHKGEFQGLGLCALPAMAQVQSLVREPRSLKLHGAAK